MLEKKKKKILTLFECPGSKSCRNAQNALLRERRASPGTQTLTYTGKLSNSPGVDKEHSWTVISGRNYHRKNTNRLFAQSAGFGEVKKMESL